MHSDLPYLQAYPGTVQDQVAFVGYDQRGNRIYETYAQAVAGLTPCFDAIAGGRR